MKVSQRSKQLQELPESHNIQGLSLSGLLGRIFIYSGVLVSLILPFYNFKSNGFPTISKEGMWQLRTGPGTAEGRQYMGAINRVQQAYYLENNAFADSIEKLGVGIRLDTEKYSYRILSPMVPVQSLDKPVKPGPYSENVMAIAQPKNPKYSSYIAAVYTKKVTNPGISDTITITGICEIYGYTPLPSTLPILINGVIQCPSGSKAVSY